MDLDFLSKKERDNSTLDTHHVDLSAQCFVITRLLTRFNTNPRIYGVAGLAAFCSGCQEVYWSME